MKNSKSQLHYLKLAYSSYTSRVNLILEWESHADLQATLLKMNNE